MTARLFPSKSAASALRATVLALFALGADSAFAAYQRVSLWGVNDYGQLGNNSTATASQPVSMSYVPDYIVKLSTGLYHTLALDVNGGLWGWGNNQYGQFGLGSATAMVTRPVKIYQSLEFKDVSSGNRFSMLLKKDGTVWSAGLNLYGQLGNGTSGTGNNSSSFVLASNLSGVSAISAGNYHAMALKTDGTVWTWGYNSNGQLGDGTRNARSTPAVVPGLTDVKSIKAGAYISFAIKNDGTLWVWGTNTYGQAGAGSTSDKLVPTQVNLSGVTSVQTVLNHTLALKSDGTVWAWGYNNYGQIGDGTTAQKNSPTQISSLSGVTKVFAGYTSSYALKQDGTVWSWGQNNYYQLLDGTTNNRSSPGQVTAVTFSNLYDIQGGYNFCSATTALVSSVTLATSGAGQVSPQSAFSAAQNDPASVTASPNAGNHFVRWTTSNPANARISNIFAAASTLTPEAANADATGVFSTDYLTVWSAGDGGSLGNGSENPSSSLVTPSNLGYVKSVFAGTYYFSGAVKSDGSVWMWGRNSHGELGNGTKNQTPIPARVVKSLNNGDYLANIVQACAGDNFTVALDSNGQIYTWGINDHGQLCQNSGIDKPYAQSVTSSWLFTNIAAGADFAMAVRNDGTVWGWGKNLSGAIGCDNTGDCQALFQAWKISDAVQISCGASHSLVLKNDGTVWVSGNNNYGQLGNGTRQYQTAHSQVSGVSGIIAAAAGGRHSLALKSDGTVLAWGANDQGQIGNGGGNDVLSPVQIPNLSGVTAIGAGYSFSMAVKSDGTMLVWGLNTYGLFGNGTTDSSAVPAQVTTLPGGAVASPSFSGGIGHSIWAAPTPLLTMAVSGSGSAIPSAGTQTYIRLKTPYNISASATTNWRFTGWTATEGAEITDAAAASTTVKLERAATVTASFQCVAANLTMAVSGNGSTSPQAGSSLIPTLTPLHISATPAPNFRFKNWTATEGASVTAPNSASTTVTIDRSATVTANFQCVSTSDFNGDGKSDLIIRGAQWGYNSTWLMNGEKILSVQTLYDGDPGFIPAATGDFDGDGKADVLWRHITGQGALIYLMNGAVMRAWGFIYTGGDPAFRVAVTGDFNGDGKTDIVWMNETTAETTVWLMNGTAVLQSGVIYPGGDKNWKIVGAGDFNGDGKCDLLWRHLTGGNVLIYQMDGVTLSRWSFIAGGGDPDFIPVATGDFNGDGKCDIVWTRRSSGDSFIQFMDGFNQLSMEQFISNQSDHYIVGTGDYNGDGIADIVIARDDSFMIYFMSGSHIVSSTNVISAYGYTVGGFGDIRDATFTFAVRGKAGEISPAAGTYNTTIGGATNVKALPGAGQRFIKLECSGGHMRYLNENDWQFVTDDYTSSLTAVFMSVVKNDFNCDSKSDIVLRNSLTTETTVCLMNGESVSSSGVVYNNGDSGWKTVGSGDFDGDGKADILWRHEVTGMVLIYFMNGTSIKSWGIIFDSDPTWRPCGVGDFNGDGKTDIIWRNDVSGEVGVWLIDGSAMTSWTSIYHAGDTAWRVSGVSDFNGDGKCDIVWTHEPDGAVLVYLMDGVTMKSYFALKNAGETGDFRVVGTGYSPPAVFLQSPSLGTFTRVTVDACNGFVETAEVSRTLYADDDVGLPTDWEIVAIGDYNGDGTDDILLRNKRDGQIIIDYMNPYDFSNLPPGIVYQGGDTNVKVGL